MSNLSASGLTRLDRFTRIGELGDALHRVLKNGIPVIGVLILLLVARMVVMGAPGWLGLLWLGAGTCVALVVWQGSGIGLPLLPLIAIQHFFVYGMPLINGNETIAGYPEALIDRAGMEVLIFLGVASAAWRLGMALFRPAKPTAFALRIFDTEDTRPLSRIGMALIGLSFGYELLNVTGTLDTVMAILPSGAGSIVASMVNAAGMAGYFLVAMFVSGDQAKRPTRTLFWSVLTAHLVLLTSSILLSSVINIVGALSIGLFWGSGRLPRTFLILCAGALGFLNPGKFEMRDRYWNAAGYMNTSRDVTTLPAFFAEWSGYSWKKLTGDDDGTEPQGKHTALARMDNMQNLLFVANSVTHLKTPVLEGETYAIIPPLLIPRVLWPEKPRTHEGQVLLNVHYGRQSRQDSLITYIAWGLLPEAYGNFGPIWGAAILGIALGLAFAGIENLTAQKPLLSMEGMVTLVVLIGIASSFEMVASVLITSMFQGVLTVIMACIPFVHSVTLVRPDPDEFESE